jgi:hypothetical protein
MPAGWAMKRKKTVGKFASVEKEILYSNAWTKLNDSARVVYFHLKGGFNDSNGDNWKLPYCDMRRIMSNATFWRGIKSLKELGVIEIVIRGGLEKKPNVYKISGTWRLKEKTLTEYQTESKGRAGKRRCREASKN